MVKGEEGRGAKLSSSVERGGEKNGSLIASLSLRREGGVLGEENPQTNSHLPLPEGEVRPFYTTSPKKEKKRDILGPSIPKEKRCKRRRNLVMGGGKKEGGSPCLLNEYHRGYLGLWKEERKGGMWGGRTENLSLAIPGGGGEKDSLFQLFLRESTTTREERIGKSVTKSHLQVGCGEGKGGEPG